MSYVYRPRQWKGPPSYLVACSRCAELEVENHDLKLQVDALRMTLDIFKKAVLADYEWRGFPDAEEYINDLVIEQIKKEADDEGKWPC